MPRPLFDRPLRQDALLRVGAFAVLIAVLWSSRSNVEVGGYFNPERLGNMVVDVWWTALWCLALLVALAWWRRLRRGPLPEPLPPAAVERSGEWTDAPPLRADLGANGQGPPRRAPELRAALSATATIIGEPVELSWEAMGADHVLVSVIPGEHPAVGTEPLHLAQSTAVTVTAVNGAGNRVVRLPLVRVLPMPAIKTMRLPAAPIMRFDARVDVALSWGDTVVQRLDAVLDEQAQRESGQLVTLPPPLSYRDIRDKVDSAIDHLAGWTPDEGRRRADLLPETAGRVVRASRLRPLMSTARTAVAAQAARHRSRRAAPDANAPQDAWWPAASAAADTGRRGRRRSPDSSSLPPVQKDSRSGAHPDEEHFAR